MNAELLRDMARHQAWADGIHWKALEEHPALRDDEEIQKRLKHMLQAMRMLTALANGETPEAAGAKASEPAEDLKAAMEEANGAVAEALTSIDLEAAVSLPRGPQGPFQAPAGVLLLQAITHSQHHRGQNASRMRQLGVQPPMTDFVIWYAIGRP